MKSLVVQGAEEQVRDVAVTQRTVAILLKTSRNHKWGILSLYPSSNRPAYNSVFADTIDSEFQKVESNSKGLEAWWQSSEMVAHIYFPRCFLPLP